MLTFIGGFVCGSVLAFIGIVVYLCISWDR